MLNKALTAFNLKQLGIRFAYAHRFGLRTFLSQAYFCEDAWSKRLDSPILSNLKMDHHFIDIDRKFNNNIPVNGVDIDLFANNVQYESQVEELEHFLFRFRKTKYAVEMMDSTVYATVKFLLKLKDYNLLFHILNNQESYGIFPDLYSYNAIMDTFVKENKFREATQIAILMMLQEDFSNEISCYLALYSCQMFLKQGSIESLYPDRVTEDNEKMEDDEEETLVRVPHIRNPFFDDHFHLTKPQHLIGKTLFLVGRQINKDLLGRTYQLLGLAMYEKWSMALDLLNSLPKLEETDLLLSEGVDEFKKYMNSITDEQLKKQIEDSLENIQQSNKIKAGDLEPHLKLKLEDLSTLEKQDIEEQLRLFDIWEKEREIALKKQNLEFEKKRRLEEIAKKKEYLYWKEKLLFFFENQNKILREYEQAKEMTEVVKSSKTKKEDTYFPPETLSKPIQYPTKYEKLARVKKLP